MPHYESKKKSKFYARIKLSNKYPVFGEIMFGKTLNKAGYREVVVTEDQLDRIYALEKDGLMDVEVIIDSTGKAIEKSVEQIENIPPIDQLNNENNGEQAPIDNPPTENPQEQSGEQILIDNPPAENPTVDSSEGQNGEQVPIDNLEEQNANPEQITPDSSSEPTSDEIQEELKRKATILANDIILNTADEKVKCPFCKSSYSIDTADKRLVTHLVEKHPDKL